MTLSDGPGKVITFYSYKGGTGRSMLLSNLAWILASNGHRVLAIDWDLEAPGLHRYFHPFLLDREVTSTDGLIDFVTRFSIHAMTPAQGVEGGPDGEWYLPFADLGPYTTSLDWEFFPPDAYLDFVPAGRQGPAYSHRVNSFEWQSFFERLGGGALLEETIRRLRLDYDYILIDSRTGVSDTSGICTIALPDLLVVCFTLNVQSIDGAAAVAHSVVEARKGRDIKIYPVPMRTDPFEKDRLERAREYAHRRFDDLLSPDTRVDKEQYWGDVEVMYQPFYAYEEVLSVFADKPGQANSVLAAVERLSARITDGEVTKAVRPPSIERDRVLDVYGRRFLDRGRDAPATRKRVDGGFVFLSCDSPDAREFARRLAATLESGSPPVATWLDVVDLESGQDWDDQVAEAIRACESMLVVVSSSNADASPAKKEWERAQVYGKPLIPLLIRPGTGAAHQPV